MFVSDTVRDIVAGFRRFIPNKKGPGSRTLERMALTKTGVRHAPVAALYRAVGSVPLPLCESAESDQSDQDDDQSDPEAPEHDREDPCDHDDAADRNAGCLSIACRHVLSPSMLDAPEAGR